ncbi:MAG: hypothetical protein IT361_10410 [Gemmatimonadaceae bacterium]|nr:hypothetical protein [Gemmatimonadaceae bacterium]
MSDEYEPIPQPDGSLDPPRTPPPTALATSAPLPEPARGPVRWLSARRTTTLGRLIDSALDALDRIGDSVRKTLGAR